MSVLRKEGCYRTKARIFATDPTEYELRWFILPDCSPLFPGQHRFGGRPWQYEKGFPIEGPGELQDVPLKWSNGTPPLGPRVFTGELSWFRDGVPDNLKPP